MKTLKQLQNLDKNNPKSLAEIIANLKFDYVSSEITEKNFPKQKVKTNFKLFLFDRVINKTEIVEEMAKENYQPANLYELLEWCKTNRSNKDWVVSFDSSHSFIVLENYRERRLNLFSVRDFWSPLFGFLGVCE